MQKTIQLVILAVLFASVADASSCPVTLISATGGPDAIVVTFQNPGKLPIRRLEFNCTLVHRQIHQAERSPCREENALFFPGAEYTVRYPYPGGVARPVLVSLRSVTLSDGHIWKPSKRQVCNILRVDPGKTEK